MSTYMNTAMYQPSFNYSNYNSSGSYGTGFSLSNYINMDTSIYQGQSFNTGYSAMSSQQQFAPQQNNSNSFLQQLVLMLLSMVIQPKGHEVDDTEVEVIPKKPDLDITVDKVAASAGGKNTLLGLNKKTGEAQILFGNATDGVGGADVDLGIKNKDDFELLLINDGWRQPAVQNAQGKDLVMRNGSLYVDNGHGNFTLVSDHVIRTGQNSADGVNHATITADGNGAVYGFEDLWGGGDRDYNDLVVKVNYGD